jgi:hypothetical protein
MRGRLTTRKRHLPEDLSGSIVVEEGRFAELQPARASQDAKAEAASLGKRSAKQARKFE